MPTIPQHNTVEYNDRVVRHFLFAAALWGSIGMLVGAYIAAQLCFSRLNFDLPWTTFPRLRALHANVMVLGLVGNVVFAGVCYSTQRLVRARLANDILSALHFWGCQIVLFVGAVTLPLGLSRGKENAELIWPLGAGIAILWVIFGVNFFWTLARRRDRGLYVAIWFYIGTIVTVPIVHIFNHLSLPTSLAHSYPYWSGAQDSLIQLWYGHSTVSFLLIAPLLGVMYHLVPKVSGQPLHSHRLAVIHFWAFAFVFGAAGSDRVLHTATPGYLQTLVTAFSLILWVVSWGGAINGLLTLRSARTELRGSPAFKFFAAGLVFFGLYSIEGAVLAIKPFAALTHFTDWGIGHSHLLALGWSGLMASGLFYFLLTKLWGRPLYSATLANLHFWAGVLGLLLYIVAMWASGLVQGMMLGATNAGNTALANVDFLKVSQALFPFQLLRFVGGGLYLSGWLMMIWNMAMTLRSAGSGNEPIETPDSFCDFRTEKVLGLKAAALNPPVVFSTLCGGFVVAWFFGNEFVSLVGLVGALFSIVTGYAHFSVRSRDWAEWHERLLGSALPLTVFIFLAGAAGGAIHALPAVFAKTTAACDERIQIPYTPLELAGRDVYVREGCRACHSQMIRVLVPDYLRYGDYSRLGESIYDLPSQWGTKRTGPDLARLSGKYSDGWHYAHLTDPRAKSFGSNMPSYRWLITREIEAEVITRRIDTQRMLGVPYPKWSQEEVRAGIEAQAGRIATEVDAAGARDVQTKEMIALIAYLQKLGKYETTSQSPKRNR